MRAAGIREIKNRLSEFLRFVRDGESVLITDHERVVAQLAPPPRFIGTQQETAIEALERLQSQGLLRVARTDMASLEEPPLPAPPFPVDIDLELAKVREESHLLPGDGETEP